VRFAAVDTAGLLEKFSLTDTGKPVSVVIWTTTPWTLPANQAVALHAELEYACVDTGTECLIVASELVDEVMKQCDTEHYQVLGRTVGSSLELSKFKHPFLEREVPIILGDHVTLEAGTGAVHTAPPHGVEDYVVGKQYNLPVDNPVNDRGSYTEDTPHVGGVFVRKADPLVIELLNTNGAMLKHSRLGTGAH